MKVVTAIEGKTQPVKQFWRRRYPVGGARHQDADLIVEIGRGLAIDLLDVVLSTSTRAKVITLRS